MAHRLLVWSAAFAALLVSSVSSAVSFDSRVPANIQKQLQDDLAFVGSIQGAGSSRIHQQIYGAVDGRDYRKFFEERIRSVGMNGCGDPSAVACVMPFYDSSTMWLTQNYVKFSHPQIARLMVVFHEARHTEDDHGNWGHATCPTPFKDAQGREMKSIWTGASLAGKPGCDRTPLGSYGSSTLMLKNIQKFCSNCSEKVKMDAGIYGDDQFGRIIDARAKKEMIDDLAN